jgi:subfamily B ATP-binding cassette protein MsbA
MKGFLDIYQYFDISFSLGHLIVGVAIVMTVRYTMSFLVRWFAAIVGKRYERYLRTQSFDSALDAKVIYYDQEGTDDILNAIITETRYSGSVISQGIEAAETLFLVSVS